MTRLYRIENAPTATASVSPPAESAVSSPVTATMGAGPEVTPLPPLGPERMYPNGIPPLRPEFMYPEPRR